MVNKKIARILLLATPTLLADSFIEGLVLSAATIVISASVWAVGRLLLKPTAQAFQQTALLVTAAGAAAICDLLLRAFVWQQHIAMQPWLPLLAVIAASAWQRDIVDNKRDACWLGLSLSFPIFIGALRDLTGDLWLELAPTVLIGAGLLIAAANRWLPRESNNGESTDRKARRVRVTGPIS